MDAEVLAIGDEITSGQTLDTNSQWISRRLCELGVRVLYHSTVGDELAPSTAVFRQAIERADVVIATGGLGPTADDLTREALAAAIGRPLVVDPRALEHIRGLFARRNRPMPDRNARQAEIPAGAEVIHNPHGTAPGIAVRAARSDRKTCLFVALPGVPAELFEMWPDVERLLRGAGAGRGVIRHRLVHCFGAGESQIEAMLPDLIRRGREPRVGITASRATITLRITAEGDAEAECEAAIAPTLATIRECLGPLVFGYDGDELQDVVLRRLAAGGESLAVVERGIGATLAEWLAASPARAAFRGGVVVGDQHDLVAGLGLPEESLRGHPAPSEELAAAAAALVRKRFAAEWGLALLVYPELAAAGGPTPVVIAAAGPDGSEARSLPFSFHPAILSAWCGKTALNMLRLRLEQGA